MTDRYELINREEGHYPISSMCRWSRVSKSGYYSWRDRPESATAVRRKELGVMVNDAFEDSDGTYGYRRIQVSLERRGARGVRAPTMNRSLASSNAARLAAENIPAPGDHHELLDAVGGLEGLHDGDDRGGLSLGVADLVQVVLTLGLEVQGGDACRHRARPLVAVRCSNRA